MGKKISDTCNIWIIELRGKLTPEFFVIGHNQLFNCFKSFSLTLSTFSKHLMDSMEEPNILIPKFKPSFYYYLFLLHIWFLSIAIGWGTCAKWTTIRIGASPCINTQLVTLISLVNSDAFAWIFLSWILYNSLPSSFSISILSLSLIK